MSTENLFRRIIYHVQFPWFNGSSLILKAFDFICCFARKKKNFESWATVADDCVEMSHLPCERAQPTASLHMSTALFSASCIIHISGEIAFYSGFSKGPSL